MATSRLPTILDVAQAAGVAPSTVSRALRDSGRVDRRTQQHVIAVAKQLGYVPSRSAQSLRSSKTHTIGILISDLRNPIFGPFIRGAEHAAQEADYGAFICDGQGSREIQEKHLRRLFEHRVDGIVLGRGFRHGGALSEVFGTTGIPFEPEFAVESEAGDVARADLEESATRAAFKYLGGLGHRRVALVTHPTDSTIAGVLLNRRLAAIRASLEEVDGGSVVSVIVDSNESTVRGAVQQLALQVPRYTCFVSGTHRLAPQVLAPLLDSGLDIPRDVSFVTYGDSDWAAAYRPPLATIRYDYYDEGRRAVDRLIARVEGRDVPSFSWNPSEFLPRGSCATASS